LHRKAGHSGALDGRNFMFINGNKSFADPHDLENAWGLKHGQAIVRIEPAKEISGKQRHLQMLYAV
jgi:hypothetical protein